MVIAIDASRAAGEQKTGVGWYAYHLISHLREEVPPDVRVLLYSDQPLPDDLRPWPTHWEERILRWPPRFGNSQLSTLNSELARWPLWSQLRLVERVLRDRPDVFFVPVHVIPLTFSMVPRSMRPRLVTMVHDVAFNEFPETYSRFQSWYANHATWLAVRIADRIIVPTNAVARDLERHYKCNPAKIIVVPHGVAQQVSKQEEQRTHDQFLLYVGRLEHKKNIVRVIQAFERIASQFPDLRLILAGGSGYGYESVRDAIERSPVRARILTPGRISEEDRQRLLSRATVFLYPTLAEGFGLAILEAMAAGVPVITSRGHAHEEVAGDAAVLVDATSVDDIARGMIQVISDDALRADLVRRGQQRASQFTWQQSAQATWQALHDVLST